MLKKFTSTSLIVVSIIGFQVQAALATEIEVTYAPANFAPMYEALAEAFMEKHPDVTVNTTGFANYNELSQRTLRSAITNQLPDVSHEGLFNIRLYADQELAVPLDGFISEEENWEAAGYSEAVTRIGQVGDTTYGIPFSISTQVIFVNNELAEQAGYDPENLPEDWDGIIELAKYIDALSDQVSGIYFDYNATAALAFQALVFSQGGSMMDADEGDITFDGAEGLWAMELLEAFGEANQLDLSRSDARTAFAAGTLGVYQNTSSNMGTFDSQATFEYTVIPVPTAPGGLLPAAGNGMVMFSSDVEQQRAAWDYIRFASSVEGQSIMVQMTGYVPVNSRVLDDTEMQTFYSANPHFAVPLTQVENLTGWYRFPGENSVRVTDAIIDSMREVVNRESTPEAALQQAASTVRSQLGIVH